MKTETIVRMIERGQVIIPEKVREAMGLQKGDLLKITIEKLKSSDQSLGAGRGRHVPLPPTNKGDTK